jgi:lipopolysaccharide transport system permease protein
MVELGYSIRLFSMSFKSMNDFSIFFLELINLPGLLISLYKKRELIITLTWRDFRARYQGSFGGLFWSFFQPLIMMVIYTIVFSSFLKIKFDISDSPFAFAVYLLCGLLPWIAFSESFSISTSLINANVNLVKKVVFPLEILPLNTVLANTITLLIGFLLLIPLAWLLNGKLSWVLLILPLIILFQTLFYTGIVWLWASFSVYLPDLRQFSTLLITVIMYLTPIFYPESVIPEWATPIMSLNPFANLVSIYRKVIMNGVLPDSSQLVGLFLTSLIVFVFGHFWFNHTKKGFADIL